jgi:hypothetical protein
MQGSFNIPSVDHLVEGRDYRIVDWSFADGMPVEKQKPEEAVQPNQQNTPPAQPPAAAPAAQPPAAAQPAPQAPAQGGACKEGEISVFGVCRKPGGSNPQGGNDFDSSNKTDEEKAAEAEAKKQGSDVKNNKPVTIGGKKYGWAIKGGKPVMVLWGAVAGEKQPSPPKTPAVKGMSGGPKPLTGQSTKPQQPGTPPKTDTAAKVAELQQAMKVPGLPESAQKALQAAIDLMGA